MQCQCSLLPVPLLHWKLVTVSQRCYLCLSSFLSDVGEWKYQAEWWWSDISSHCSAWNIFHESKHLKTKKLIKKKIKVKEEGSDDFELVFKGSVEWLQKTLDWTEKRLNCSCSLDPLLDDTVLIEQYYQFFGVHNHAF